MHHPFPSVFPSLLLTGIKHALGFLSTTPYNQYLLGMSRKIDFELKLNRSLDWNRKIDQIALLQNRKTTLSVRVYLRSWFFPHCKTKVLQKIMYPTIIQFLVQLETVAHIHIAHCSSLDLHFQHNNLMSSFLALWFVSHRTNNWTTYW